MSLSKLGVGVIGTGMAATPHAKALNDLRDHIDLRGVFSRNAEKCKTFASRFELPFIKNIEDLINDPKLDIIIIITPPNQRLKLVQQFSDAGKHILMEKPVERSSAKAKIIVNLCKENKMPAIALTDTQNMFGAFEFSLTCQKNRVQPILGINLQLENLNPMQLMMMAMNMQ